MHSWSSLPHLLRERARVAGEREAMRFQGASLTLAGLDAAASRWADVLADLGVRQGERVALCLPNGLDAPAAWLGVASLGAVVVPINYGYRDADLRFMLSDSGAVLAVTTPERAPDLLRAAARCLTVRTVAVLGAVAPPGGEPIADRLARASPSRDLMPPALNDLVTLQYTSGTTGFPKGCMLTHGYWLLLADTAVEYGSFTPDDVMLSAAPIWYLDGMWHVALALTAGIPLVILPRFSASGFWRTVRENGITFFYCLGTMPVLLLKQPPNPELERGHKVRFVMCSGIVPRLHATFEERWGCPWREAYGTTEVGAGLMVPLEDTTSVGSGLMGRVAAHREARVVDPDTHRVVPPGTPGELQLRGPSMMLGYWGHQEASDRYFHEGWAHTGDLVEEDARGYFRMVGRLKDMIRRGGENVSAVEVESVLAEHPSVVAAACVPVADEIRGEEIKAFVQLSPGREALAKEPEALRTWLTQRLAAFKVPRYFAFVDKFPLTPSERIAKHQLKPGRTWDATIPGWKEIDV
jgi:crotonobetaine/carnitine-CoA ligase